MGSVVYLDVSALVKLVVEEPESRALTLRLQQHQTHASASLAATELFRAVRRADPGALPRARALLGTLVTIQLTPTLLETAGLLEPTTLRSLDAIHLVAARSLGSDLDALFTYDERMIGAATSLGVPTLAPA